MLVGRTTCHTNSINIEGIDQSTGTPLEGLCISYLVANDPPTHLVILLTTSGVGDPSGSINTLYVEGVSVTHGNPRQHIWTFANGLDEQGIYRPCNHQYYVSICPCVNRSTDGSYVPSFVGQNYFCESGIVQWNGVEHSGVLWSDGDPLWDGQGCGPTSSCCTFNSPPWFNVRLSPPTTDYIEVRICSDDGVGSDSPIQLIELYQRVGRLSM